MSFFNSKFNEFLKNNLTKDTLIRSVFFLIPLASIVLKGIIFQGFVTSQNPYVFSFSTGYNSASSCLNYYIAFALIFLSFSLLFKGKGRIIYTFVIYSILTLIMLIDTWYFRGFLTVPSVLTLTQTANLDSMSGSILSMTSKLDSLFLFDFLIIAIYAYITRK